MPRTPQHALALTLAFGCAAPGGPVPAQVEAEARQLARMIDEDASLPLLEEVERLSEQRPYLAARRLDQAALPAARRQMTRFEVAAFENRVFRALCRRARRAYRARVEALERYRRVLAAGARDAERLALALAAQSRAEAGIRNLRDEVRRARGRRD